jgi:hypothetical protein
MCLVRNTMEMKIFVKVDTYPLQGKFSVIMAVVTRLFIIIITVIPISLCNQWHPTFQCLLRNVLEIFPLARLLCFDNNPGL